MAARKRDSRDIWDAAGDLPDRYCKVAELERMIRSRSAPRRLLALLIMNVQSVARRKPKSYLRLARQMIEDSDNTCRWQALSVVAQFIEDRPDEVWEVVKEYGDHEDEDMRMGVACVVLEHLLEHHWSKHYRKAKRLAARSPLFADTLDTCWDFRE